jgi:predicted permease
LVTTLLVAAGAFVLGGAAGVAASRPGIRLVLSWAGLVRSQLALTAVILSLLSAWWLEQLSGLAAPLAPQLAPIASLAVALTLRGRRNSGEATLESWGVTPNSGFWVIPIAAAVAGAEGVMLAVLADRLSAPRVAFSMHLLRRHAPTPQRTRTALIDHSPTLALAAGLLLSRHVSAPGWSAMLLQAAGPVLAASGAFLYVASIRPGPGERSVRDTRPTREQLRRWSGLTCVRIAVVACVAWLLDDPAVWVVSALFAFSAPAFNPPLRLRRATRLSWPAFSAPAFNPPQLARLYGYDVQPALAGSAGWMLAPIGLALAILAATQLNLGA